MAFRIAAMFSLTFALGLVVAFVVTYLEISYSLEEASREVISTKLQEVKAVLVLDDVQGVKQAMTSEQALARNAPFLIRVLNSDGEPVFLKQAVQEKEFDLENVLDSQKHLDVQPGWRSFDAVDDEDRFDLLTEKMGDRYFVQVGRSNEERQEVLERLTAGFAGAAIVLTIVGSLFGVWYARRALAPVRELIAIAKEIEAGDLSRRVPVPKEKGELRDLAETFNRMIGRIEKVVFVMKESIDHLAHEIRTPLARIRAVSEHGLLNAMPEVQRDALSDSMETVSDLTSMVEQILLVSESEAGTVVLTLEETDVFSMLAEVADLYEVVAEESNQVIEIHGQRSEPVKWNLDRKKMKRAIGNLIDNALKFSPANTSVHLHFQATPNGLVLEVRDEGLGIGPGEANRIWDRLFRGDRSRSTKGSGLGLAICKAIVEAHGGKIGVTPNIPAGSIFSIQIPNFPKSMNV